MTAVIREISLDAPADVVWRAITDADELSRWFGDDVAGDLVADGAASFGDRLALLTHADPDEGTLGFRWIDGGEVTFTVTEADDGGTDLRVVETQACVGGRVTALAAHCSALAFARA